MDTHKHAIYVLQLTLSDLQAMCKLFMSVKMEKDGTNKSVSPLDDVLIVTDLNKLHFSNVRFTDTFSDTQLYLVQ